MLVILVTRMSPDSELNEYSNIAAKKNPTKKSAQSRGKRKFLILFYQVYPHQTQCVTFEYIL